MKLGGCSFEEKGFLFPNFVALHHGGLYMGVIMIRWCLVGFMVITALVLDSQARAEEWKTANRAG